MTMRQDLYLEVDGARLRFRNDGAGPAVVLIHGWTLDLDMWGPQVAALADRFRMIRFDRRGFGLSTGRPSLKTDLADTRRLCAHMGVERAAFIGMSQGARVVAALAAAFPQLVRCFVLDGAPVALAADGSLASSELPLDEYRALVRSEGIEAFRRLWAGHPMTRLTTADPAAHALLARMLARYRGDDLLEMPLAPAAAGQALALESIGQPALVLSGEFDLPNRRTAANEIARRLGQGRSMQVPNAGHLCNLDNPPAYNALLQDFLQQHAGA